MNDNTLVIISAQANTSGIYTCVAQNEVGEYRQEIYIDVNGMYTKCSMFYCTLVSLVNTS